MSIIQAIILGILQGITEFLPISSSGHLSLMHYFFPGSELDPYTEKTFDVALHFGSLLGALYYLRKEVTEIVISFLKFLKTKKLDSHAKFGLLLLVASVPGALVGALFQSVIVETLSNPYLIASALIVFGIILYLCDKYSKSIPERVFNLKDAIIVGSAQALALQPGVSRSGITMSILRVRGFDRVSSARYSFLMLLPIVAGATIYSLLSAITGEGISSDLYLPMIVGTIAAAISGWLAVFGLLKIVKTQTFAMFTIYRVALGLIVIIALILE